MKKYLVVLGLLLSIYLYTKVPFYINEEIKKEIKSRTVKISAFNDCESGQGTGTLIGGNRILTAAHLFPEKDFCKYPAIHIPILGIDKKEEIFQGGKTEIYFKKYEDENYRFAAVVSSDTKKDIAILEFKGEDKAPEFFATSHWFMGEPVLLIGNPGMEDFMEGSTRLVGLSIIKNPMGYTRPLLLFPCGNGQPGFSGSGIYNAKGEYLGIFELASTRFDACFAIPAKELIDSGIIKENEK